MISVAFTSEQKSALTTLQQIWTEEQMVLVGASALGCFMDMRWRQTYDLDISISVSLEKCMSDLKKLPGWSPESKPEHRWDAPGGVRIDIIPASPRLLAAREIVWPKSGNRMSLLGLRLAFENNERIQIADDIFLRVAQIPVVAALKMIAFQDSPTERTRDLADLAYILEEFLAEDDPRRFDDEVFQSGLAYEETSAFFLGKDIGKITNEAELARINAFLEILRDESHTTLAQSRMLIASPASWRKDPKLLLQRLEVFDKGLRSRNPGQNWR
jgi:predicted nucleotidyltransferase